MRFRGIKHLLGAALIGFISIGSAQSATVNIGTLSFDDSTFADTVSVVSGDVPNVANIIDKDLVTNATLDSGFFGTDVIEVGFTDNLLVNNTGIDLLVFERFSDEESPLLSLTFGGPSIAGVFLESIMPGGINQTTVFGFDLDLLGITAGAIVAGNVFFTINGNTPDIAEIAAIDSGTTVVPLPAALPLFAGGLGLLGLIGWRRKRVATA